MPLPVGFRQNLPAPQLRKKILHWVKCRKAKALESNKHTGQKRCLAPVLNKLAVDAGGL